MKHILEDEQGNTLEVEVLPDGKSGLSIKTPDHGCFEDSDSGPVYIELYEGRLRMIVWGDARSADPTHTIELDGAKLEGRKWFALTGDGEIVLVGIFPDYDSADTAAAEVTADKNGIVWLLDEVDAAKWQKAFSDAELNQS